MSTKLSILFLVIAIVLGVATSVGTKSYIASQTQGFEILVANQDIPAGLVVEPESFGIYFSAKTVPMSFENMKSWVITPGQKALILGRAPTVDIPKDNLVTLSQFDPVNVQREVFAQLEEGERAVSLSVDMKNSVSNIIRPGDFVDIIVIFPGRIEGFEQALSTVTQVEGEEPEAATSALDKYKLEVKPGLVAQQAGASDAPLAIAHGIHARTLLQRVRVLGVGERFNDFRYTLSGAQDYNYNIVTLKLSLDDTQKLILAQELGGRMTLTLRHPDDEGIVEMAVTEQDAIF